MASTWKYKITTRTPTTFNITEGELHGSADAQAPSAQVSCVGLDGPAGPGEGIILQQSQRRPGSTKWPSEYRLHLVAWQEKLTAQQLLEHDVIIRLRK